MRILITLSYICRYVKFTSYIITKNGDSGINTWAPFRSIKTIVSLFSEITSPPNKLVAKKTNSPLLKKEID